LVRLQGRIVALKSPVRAPVAGQDCAMFTACAAELRLDGVQAPPVSFYSAGSDFELELCRGARVSERVRVSGGQVSMAGMVDGRHYRVALFSDSPSEIQDLVKGQINVDESTVLELTESCLCVGAEVTCVGKLLRAATGQLHLLPPDANSGMVPCAGQLMAASCTESTGESIHTFPKHP